MLDQQYRYRLFQAQTITLLLLMEYSLLMIIKGTYQVWVTETRSTSNQNTMVTDVDKTL